MSVAQALKRVQKAAKANGGHIVRSLQIKREDREILVRTKWLQEIIKGWYLLVKPDLSAGDSSAWHANFWDFLRLYLSHYYGTTYCLSAESSLDLHTGNTVIPRQVIVISAKGGGAPLELPFETSVYVYKDPINLPEEKMMLRGLQVMTLPYAISKVTPSYFQKNPQEVEIALKLIRNSDQLTEVFLRYNFKNAAERLIGAYEFLGNQKMAEEIREDLVQAGWKIKGTNPLSISAPFLQSDRLISPHVARIFSLWADFREKIIPIFPLKMKKGCDLGTIEELYEKDAYNSLSIEGYHVDDELFARVQNDHWNPDIDLKDRSARDALAARGYFEAFQEVKKTLAVLQQGQNSGIVIEKALRKWFHSLFAPCVQAGILRHEDIIGYRKSQVYIRSSRHIPLPKEVLVEAMDALFECLKSEENAAVCAVLGHYIFVYIHPYMDGNGRVGRFLMNAMFISGGYPWTIIRVKNRKAYLDALEIAGTERNIEPFAHFIAKEMKAEGNDH